MISRYAIVLSGSKLRFARIMCERDFSALGLSAVLSREVLLIPAKGLELATDVFA